MKHKKKRCKIVAKSFQNRFKQKKTQKAKSSGKKSKQSKTIRIKQSKTIRIKQSKKRS
jgi:hypothetical protein